MSVFDPLFIDLETIPDQRHGALDEFINNVQAPGQYKKPESIAEWLRDNAEVAGREQWLKTSFSGSRGQIAVIGFARCDEAPQAFNVKDLSLEAEADMLKAFFAHIQAMGTVQWVGHNIVNFDLRMLRQRAMVLGVKPCFCLPMEAKPWSDMVHDTMVRWTGSQRDYVSQDELCDAFGLPPKPGIDGSMVWPLIEQGRIDEVVSYCRDHDVPTVRDIFKRQTFQA